MESNHLRELLASARKTFDETGQIPDKLKQAIAQCCSKQYVLDFIAELGSMPTSSGFLRTLSGCWKHQSERVWWVITLYTLRPPLSDPVHWQPTLADYRFLKFLLDEADSLDVPREDFVALVHYPLARIVDDILMSGASIGCGMETVGEWKTPAFYDRLLTADLPSSTARGLLPMARAEALIAQILRILENHGVPRLRLGIGSATLYYGIRDVGLQSARENLIIWLVERSVGPYLLYLIRYGMLLPHDGVLAPDFQRITTLEKRPTVMNGLLGPVSSSPLAKAILRIEALSPDEDYPTGNARVDECVASFFLWHESLEHFEALEEALTQ